MLGTIWFLFTTTRQSTRWLFFMRSLRRWFCFYAFSPFHQELSAALYLCDVLFNR
uniref:Uncharacterized protein n=1 Tax=virus sp. ctah610 TaxID=2826807 RepID=A0A8S5R6M4_9VIRU|nr:MAG TPA: hypothetical protein [virus sp. ctah610]